MNKSQEKYLLVIRGLALGVVSFLWYLSIIWSADGFSINDPELHWIGIGLALSITVVQLVFNRGSANPTIFLVGLAAYIYGFATNFIGITKVVGLEFTMQSLTENPFGFLAAGIGVIGLSVIVEAAPESFLLWALYPKEQSPGDFISSLFKGAKLPGRNGKSNFQPTASTGFGRTSFVPVNGSMNKQTSERTNQQTNGFPKVNWRSLAKEEQRIISHAQTHFQKHNELPNSPTDVSKALYQTTKKKGYVSTVLKNLREGKYS